MLLDYILPYALVGTAGFFKPWFDKEESSKKKILILCLGALVGGLLKFFSHFIVGVLVWAPMGYDWGIESEALYSFAYNIAFTGPSIVLSAAVLVVMYKRAPRVICSPKDKTEFVPQEHIKAYDLIINPTLVATGLFLFVYFLIKYIMAAQLVDKGWAYKYNSNQDSVFLLFTGLLLVLIFGICIIKTLKNKQDNRLTTIALIAVTSSHVIYSIAKILICYLDEWQNPTIYIVWMVVSFLLVLIFIGLYLLVKQILENKEKTGQAI